MNSTKLDRKHTWKEKHAVVSLVNDRGTCLAFWAAVWTSGKLSVTV